MAPLGELKRKMMKVKIVWQENAISCMKSFGKLNCSLCMRERIEILSTIRQEEWRIINHCKEIYGACRHNTKLYRFLKEHTDVKNTTTDEGDKPEKGYKYDDRDGFIVIRMILRNHRLVRRALLTSPNIRMLLTSVRHSSYVYSMMMIQRASCETSTRQPRCELGGSR
jgi:hypothetical protein